MIDDHSADKQIRAWIDRGPEAASSEFIDRTMRPIPRMRQRRSWWIAVERLAAPLGPVAVAAALVVIVAIGGSAVLRGIPRIDSPGAGASASPPLGTYRPTFELTLGEGASARVYRSDPTASLATCNVKPDGPSYALYAGGEPFVNIDFLVGIGAEKPGGETRVAAEISAEDYYVRFDPAILRGGDAAGRSQATVAISAEGEATTFVVTATTPNGRDGAPIRVSLTLTCQP